jgi:ketosteroid isomerase-like protein
MTFFRQLQFPISILQRLTPRRKNQSLSYGLLGIILGAVIGFGSSAVQAQSPNTAPDELTTFLDQVETAANRQDIEAVMEFYSADFTNTDGFNRQNLQQFLTQFWKQFSDVNYEMELQSWEQDGSAILATTVTRITGTQTLNNREFQLEATITSQQRIDNQQIIQQDILAETNQLTSGEEPPTVTFNVPETVSVQQSYNVDAIVQEPLGEDIMIGAAVEQTIDPNIYFSPETLEMELLNTGGLFKIGEAPPNPEQKWISAVLMRKGGIVSVTQRVRIVP